MSFEEHRKRAPKKLRIAVLVVSDTRSAAMAKGLDEDVSGKIIVQKARESGHEALRTIVPDEKAKIRRAVKEFLEDDRIDAIIITGGTGIARRDVTIETITPLYDKELPGFGEILRRVGYDMVGTPALLTRASAGIIKGKPVFCLPGAPNAVETGMGLILPELGHIIKHARE